jgi:EAL domain-containing protein (putative c-di-GMP-specific phosphodiesterase class I)
MTRALSAAGFEVSEAEDGRRAAELVANAAFDAVVTDVMMPGMSGIELLRTVRERDLDLPVLLISGAPNVDSALEAVRHGASDYIVKPFELAALERKVRRAVRLHELARAKREALRVLSTGKPEPGDRTGLEVIFDRALESLWLAYQPIVDASSREPFGYEALLRSSEPALPHPGAVLDAAERLDRLEDIGRAVRSKAPVPMESVPPSALLFVNLHARDLSDESLLHPSSPLSSMAPRVVLEITERASMDEVKDVKGTIGRLREMGFRIAVDDLGAGYAGLTSFAQLEPDFVKLDMTLIRDVDKDPLKQKLVRSMTAVCRDMGIAVVAEGIETHAERDTAIELGCGLLQGYLLARPGKPFPVFTW